MVDAPLIGSLVTSPGRSIDQLRENGQLIKGTQRVHELDNKTTDTGIKREASQQRKNSALQIKNANVRLTADRIEQEIDSAETVAAGFRELSQAGDNDSRRAAQQKILDGLEKLRESIQGREASIVFNQKSREQVVIEKLAEDSQKRVAADREEIREKIILRTLTPEQEAQKEVKERVGVRNEIKDLRKEEQVERETFLTRQDEGAKEREEIVGEINKNVAQKEEKEERNVRNFIEESRTERAEFQKSQRQFIEKREASRPDSIAIDKANTGRANENSNDVSSSKQSHRTFVSFDDQIAALSVELSASINAPFVATDIQSTASPIISENSSSATSIPIGDEARAVQQQRELDSLEQSTIAAIADLVNEIENSDRVRGTTNGPGTLDAFVDKTLNALKSQKEEIKRVNERHSAESTPESKRAAQNREVLEQRRAEDIAEREARKIEIDQARASRSSTAASEAPPPETVAQLLL